MPASAAGQTAHEPGGPGSPDGSVGLPLRIAALAMTLLLLVATAVQANDPDPARWMGLYGSAALLSALAAAGRLPLAPLLAALLLYLGFAAAWAPALAGSRPEAFSSFHMEAPEDEEPREAGGLLLCVAWTALLSHRAWQLRRARAGRKDTPVSSGSGRLEERP